MQNPQRSCLIQEFHNTDIFLEKDPACQSGLVCGGNCLARHQVCDSLNDCQNVIDEAECNFPTCNPDEFPCLSGRCIPAGWKCDGKPDCRTAEDEVTCTASFQPGEFLCREGKCISELHVCDGIADCGQADDEVSENSLAMHFSQEPRNGVPRVCACLSY